MFPTDHDFRRYAIAQATANRVATQIAQQIEPGMTEADAYNLAEASFQREGIRRHRDPPVIGLGEGTLKLRSIGALTRARITRGRRYAASGDALMIDIAPVVDGYPSDFTWSGALGAPSATPLSAAAHKFAQSVVSELAPTGVGSDIWRSAEILASTDGAIRWAPVPVIGLGHRLMRIPTAWLHWSGARYLYLALTRGPAFLSGPRAERLRGFWTIEPYLSDGPSRGQVRANGVRGRQRALGGRSRQRRTHMAGYPEGALMRPQGCITASSLCAAWGAGPTPNVDTLAGSQITMDGLT